MSFDDKTRSALSAMVVACRRHLKEDVTDQLQKKFGMYPDGTTIPTAQLDLGEDEKAAAAALRELLTHFTAGEKGRAEKLGEGSGAEERRSNAYDRLVLEISFTALNRLAALRLCEERGLISECVRKGTASDGFRLFERVSGGALGTRYETYKVFLDGIFDELAQDLGILFDRTTPQSALFPSERCLESVMAELNDQELAHLWAADETIGWIYQYFNPPEERAAMRDASPAPRNSRELAVRNQFFTPRYVVEFLTDNTLGRIWFEMRKGNTSLNEECRHLVRRPNEIFLAPGEKEPTSDNADKNLSQEELLKRPIHVEHRPMKDPRDLRVLDPACGSGHFLLYAFDLLERVYDEAWQDLGCPESEGVGHTLRNEFETIDDLRREVPRLIIEHNLHGIDIDSRAVQIAALALWLRAQKTWKAAGLKANNRPRIKHSNIVTAEPMPGEEDILRKFTADLKPRVLGQLVDVVFEKMKLAGEAGSLLKIEEEIKDSIAAAKAEWRRTNEDGYFPGMAPPHEATLFDFTDLSDLEFWEEAENLILSALKSYAEQAESGGSLRRRLFAEDTARGFAFIDLCTKRYDVALLNPPFGEFPTSLKRFATAAYETSKSDIGFSMLARAADLTNDRSYTGALLSRLFIVNDGVTTARETLLTGHTSVDSMIDLGYGVLDGALVEVAALCVRKRLDTRERPAFFLRVLDEQEKEVAVTHYFTGLPLRRTFSYLVLPSSFRSFNKTLLCYWLPPALANTLKGSAGLAGVGGDAHFGASTSDDFQFVRLRWEVSPKDFTSQSWVPFAKGGEYSPFIADLSLVLEWREDGRRLKEFVGRKSFETQGAGGWTRWINGVEFYFKEGLTYPERTTSDLCPQVLPSGCLFSAIGSAIHFADRSMAQSYLGAAFTMPFKILADAVVGSGDSSVSGSAARHYRPGIVNSLPLLGGAFSEPEIHAVESCVNLTRERQSSNELYCGFTGACFHAEGKDLINWARSREKASLSAAVEVIDLCALLEDGVVRRLGLTEDDIAAMSADFGPHPASFPRECATERLGEVRRAWSCNESELIAQAIALQGARRQLTKKTFLSDRRLELVAQLYGIHPSTIVSAVTDADTHPGLALFSGVRDLLSYAVGCALGRWDVRMAIDPSVAPKLGDPFDAIPECPPGMLVSTDGMPAESGRIVSDEWLRARACRSTSRCEGSTKKATIADSDYPLRVSWDGILVDDVGINGGQAHRDDIVRRVLEVLELLWTTEAHGIEQEICEEVGCNELREYFRRPAGFFQDHLTRYSKSRRKAPIYWPLSTASGSYTIWLYYHGLTDQTLYAAVNKYLEPKITAVEHAATHIVGEIEKASGPAATRLRDRLSEARTFVGELRDLRSELLRIASLPYKPNLSDGVIINAAPFYRLFRLRSWAKDTEQVWKDLEKGGYDWAHLAYTMWPGRVKETCRKDRSMAIAHGLEELCEIERPDAERSGKRKGRAAKKVAR